MSDITYPKTRTALLFVDPYNASCRKAAGCGRGWRRPAPPSDCTHT